MTFPTFLSTLIYLRLTKLNRYFTQDVVSGGADALLSSADDLLAGSNEGGTSDQDWNLDPAEPRYCVCNQV